MKGRKPKPVEARRVLGTVDHHTPPPIVPGGRPLDDELATPPAALDADGAAAWTAIVPSLVDLGLIARSDVPMLVMLCRQIGRAERAAIILREEGYVSIGSRGQLVEHPMMAIERSATTLAARLGEQFAITPVARARAGIAIEVGRRVAALNEQLGPQSRAPADGAAIDVPLVYEMPEDE